MSTSKEKIIDFIGVLRDFMGSSSSISDDEKSEKKLSEWKKENNVTDKNIIDLEEMLEHKDAKPRQRKRKNQVGKISSAGERTQKPEILDFENEVEKIENSEQQEQGRGA